MGGVNLQPAVKDPRTLPPAQREHHVQTPRWFRHGEPGGLNRAPKKGLPTVNDYMQHNRDTSIPPVGGAAFGAVVGGLFGAGFGGSLALGMRNPAIGIAAGTVIGIGTGAAVGANLQHTATSRETAVSQMKRDYPSALFDYVEK